MFTTQVLLHEEQQSSLLSICRPCAHAPGVHEQVGNLARLRRLCSPHGSECESTTAPKLLQQWMRDADAFCVRNPCAENKRTVTVNAALRGNAVL
jgi:hypothetical protein